MEEVAGESPAAKLKTSGGNIQHMVGEDCIGQMPVTGAQGGSIWVLSRQVAPGKPDGRDTEESKEPSKTQVGYDTDKPSKMKT